MAHRNATPEQRAQVGAALHHARELRGWSTSEFARRVGIEQRTVGMIERGRTGISMSMLFTLCEALECSWRELLGPEPGTDSGHSSEWEAGFRAGVGEAHAALDRMTRNRGMEP